MSACRCRVYAGFACFSRYLTLYYLSLGFSTLQIRFLVALAEIVGMFFAPLFVTL